MWYRGGLSLIPAPGSRSDLQPLRTARWSLHLFGRLRTAGPGLFQCRYCDLPNRIRLANRAPSFVSTPQYPGILMLKLVIRHALIKCGKGGAGISSSHCVAQTAVIIHVEVVTVGGPGICTINGAMQPYQNAASISICRHSADRTWYLKIGRAHV